MLYSIVTFMLCLSPAGDKYPGDGEMTTLCFTENTVWLNELLIHFNPQGGSSASCHTASLHITDRLSEHQEIAGGQFEGSENKIRLKKWNVQLVKLM